ncbi:MAG: hypothetical protein AB1473_06540 [Thermodesulfobacteriota bacterium]
MIRKIFRELAIFLACMALLPAFVFVTLLQRGILDEGLRAIGKALAGGGWSLDVSIIGILARWVAPYLIVQCIRAYVWSKTSPRARSLANLYYSVILASLAAWCFWKAWDVFYYMYALGDIPGQIAQFVEIEYQDLLLFVVTTILSIYCFAIFLDPRPKRNLKDRAKGG